jgi:hypothetical protein
LYVNSEVVGLAPVLFVGLGDCYFVGIFYMQAEFRHYFLISLFFPRIFFVILLLGPVSSAFLLSMLSRHLKVKEGKRQTDRQTESIRESNFLQESYFFSPARSFISFLCLV